MKDIIWTQHEWKIKAKNLLDNLRKFPKNSPITLIMRHSARLTAEDIREDPKFRLTEEGKRYAKYFGQHLPVNRSKRIYHSRIDRCKETAEGILEGLKRNKNNIRIEGVLNTLYDVGISTEDFYSQVEEYPFEDFLYRWVAGLIPKDMIPLFPKYARKAAKTIWGIHNRSENNDLIIHITHDLIILCLRLGWFGLKPTGIWPPFLNGFAFTFKKNKILIFDFDYFTEVKLPYWWKDNKISL